MVINMSLFTKILYNKDGDKMKINNKGFAISVILYSMVILVMGIMYLLLDVLNSRYKMTETAKSEIINYVNNQGVNTVSEEYTSKLATYKLIKMGNMYYDTTGNYYYTGANPSNYVKFNNDDWRIIGVINVSNAKYVKLVKANSLKKETPDNYKIADSNILTYLNNDYYVSMASNDRSLIAKVNWYNSPYNVNVNPHIAYSLENSNPSANYIGLINGSDFGLTASSSFYNNALNNYASSKDSNWLSMDIDYFTMGYQGSKINIVRANGNLESVELIEANIIPCVYLKKDVLISTGDGTMDNPFVFANS